MTLEELQKAKEAFDKAEKENPGALLEPAKPNVSIAFGADAKVFLPKVAASLKPIWERPLPIYLNGPEKTESVKLIQRIREARSGMGTDQMIIRFLVRRLSDITRQPFDDNPDHFVPVNTPLELMSSSTTAQDTSDDSQKRNMEYDVKKRRVPKKSLLELLDELNKE